MEQLTQFEGVYVDGYDDLANRDVILIENNSLNFLRDNQDTQPKFDVVFLDGDHNYYTVTNELKLIQNMIKPTSIIICDDYNGRWAENDMFYADKEEYKSVEIATPRRLGAKQGVRNAVIDFIDTFQKSSNEERWAGLDLPSADPIILYRDDVWKKLSTSSQPQWMFLRDRELAFERLEDL